MLPLLLAASALAFTGCYDEPYYGRGRGYSGVYASYGGPGPYYGGYGGYGYDPYGPYYGPRYGPGYGSTVVAVRTSRRGYYANRGRWRNRGAYARSRDFRRRGDFRRRQQVRDDGNAQGGVRQGGRSGRIEAATQPE